MDIAGIIDLLFEGLFYGWHRPRRAVVASLAITGLVGLVAGIHHLAFGIAVDVPTILLGIVALFAGLAVVTLLVGAAIRGAVLAIGRMFA